MPAAAIVSAVRTPIGIFRKGSLRETPAEELATHIARPAAARSGPSPDQFDDVVLGEPRCGGGDLARCASVAAGMVRVSGQAVNRHCASRLAAVGPAAAGIRAGLERAVIAGGAPTPSMSPAVSRPVPAPVSGLVDVHVSGCSPGHPIAATGARMLTTPVHEPRRRGGGIGVATMCAGGGHGGALLVEVG